MQINSNLKIDIIENFIDPNIWLFYTLHYFSSWKPFKRKYS